MFQSTRPRGARLDWRAPNVDSIEVSIHAPTGGATSLFPSQTLQQWFQSTRPRGARPGCLRHSDCCLCFNPRAHGGRDCRTIQRTCRCRVSIHAPTGGATWRRLKALKWLSRFQSTRPRGARQHFGTILTVGNEFQSTRPRGARLTSSLQGARLLGFNPRAHGGRDS